MHNNNEVIKEVIDIQRHRIERIDKSDEFALVIYLDDFQTEFASEFGIRQKKKQNLVEIAKSIVHNQYPKLKVSVVKVVLGGLVLTSFQLNEDTDTASAQSSSPNDKNIQQVDSSLYYQVAPGDTLWGLSKKFNTTVQDIRQANNLLTDTLSINQKLLIPKAIHTVKTGDYLSILARDYGTTIWAIREANNLNNDTVLLGQKLIIPADLSKSKFPTSTVQSYSVQANDTLYSISKRFGKTVDEMRTANQLTSDILSIGQVLQVPNGDNSGEPGKVPTPEPSPPSDGERVKSGSHSVMAGDTLYSLANRFGVSVDALRKTNNLTSDILSIGQVLTIPKTTENISPAPPTAKEETRTTFDYRVASGDSLSAIANRFGVTIEGIKKENNLKSESLQIGQILTIPNGTISPVAKAGQNTITYKTHTIASGDNIWDLSVRYGIPQAELLKANNLTTSSRLTVGQKIKLPVHNIAVKETVSAKHGELLDWWTEAQYVFAIGKTAKVTDLATGKSFNIKRTVGANHADSETVTQADTNTAKSIWGGFSWKTRAVILEVDGRKLAASMSFMPHEREFIANNGISGHFDVYFSNSTRHVDGKPDPLHQAQVEKAAGLR